MVSARDIANRAPLTACLIMATLMNSIDTTIANVALPRMQGSFSASQDQMAWVLTSYIVAVAVTIPLSGWVARRLGYKVVFLGSIAGFTVTSMLCGAATSLPEIVAFRFAQGVCGASMYPLSQAVLLELFPARMLGQVMALWGSANLLGPVIGPLLGGWLTDNFSWRWVFYINLPLGILSLAGVWLLMDFDKGERPGRFDFLGYGALVVFIAGLQLMLDRGQTQDWFSSKEIWVETIGAAIGFYVFMVHSATTRRPFFDPSLALDRNFVMANILSTLQGMLLFSTLAMQPPMMQGLMGYPVFAAGLVMSPRGVGTSLAMLGAGSLLGRIDSRLILLVGLSLVALAQLQMSQFDLSMDGRPFVVAGLIQGVGMGCVFVPINTLAFATLNPRLRAEGASVFNLVRGLGQSVGISLTEALFANRAAVAHGDLASAVQSSSPVLAAGLPAALNPATASGLVNLNGEITRQADMVAYIDVFRLGAFACLATIPLLLFLRPPKQVAELAEVAID